MGEKRFEILKDEELNAVSGGTDNGTTDRKRLEACPDCGETLLAYRFDWIDGAERYLSHCTNCHHAFYFNESGAMVSLGKYC